MRFFKTILILLIVFISLNDVNAQVIKTNRAYFKERITIVSNIFNVTEEQIFWINKDEVYKFNIYTYEQLDEGGFKVLCITQGKECLFYINFDREEVYVNNILYYKDKL